MLNLKTDGINGLMEELGTRKLVCFGAGSHFDTVMRLYASYRLEQYVEYIADNNASLNNTYKKYQDAEYRIVSLEVFRQKADIRNTVLLVTSHMYCMEIVSQLDREARLDGMDVYIGSFLSDVSSLSPSCEMNRTGAKRIPKTIHYCWFGKGTMPYVYRQYMDSWKRLCPDYKIRKWDESNFDVSANRYMKQAYEHGKWAFVSDYARIKIVHDHGGIYLDCDVELLKSLDDFLAEGMFCGFEDQNHVNLGLGYGAVKNHPYLRRLMGFYERLDFVNADGSLNLIPCTAYQTEVLKEFGIRDNNTFQTGNGITVYPTEVFAPVSPFGAGAVSDRSYSIHHYQASWQPEKTMEKVNHMYKEYCRRKEACVWRDRGDQRHSARL